jgi:hypothetical protein
MARIARRLDHYLRGILWTASGRLTCSKSATSAPHPFGCLMRLALR